MEGERLEVVVSEETVLLRRRSVEALRPGCLSEDYKVSLRTGRDLRVWTASVACGVGRRRCRTTTGRGQRHISGIGRRQRIASWSRRRRPSSSCSRGVGNARHGRWHPRRHGQRSCRLHMGLCPRCHDRTAPSVPSCRNVSPDAEKSTQRSYPQGRAGGLARQRWSNMSCWRLTHPAVLVEALLPRSSDERQSRGHRRKSTVQTVSLFV